MREAGDHGGACTGPQLMLSLALPACLLANTGFVVVVVVVVVDDDVGWLYFVFDRNVFQPPLAAHSDNKVSGVRRALPGCLCWLFLSR